MVLKGRKVRGGCQLRRISSYFLISFFFWLVSFCAALKLLSLRFTKRGNAACGRWQISKFSVSHTDWGAVLWDTTGWLSERNAASFERNRKGRGDLKASD